MDEITGMRIVYDLLKPLSSGDRVAALGWLTAMLGESELSPSDRAAAEVIMTGGVLSYQLYARGAALAALGKLAPAARSRTQRWVSSVLLAPSPAAKPVTS
ncbi:hypothetical protein [Streptomyces sp. NBC_01237]|uniref:hypothetical protein n=1 Tax=Streptomyces sp. NBC_01237 TaxID=2903790 RepID=UPI002DDBB826|nr:hypothetical protein [Streptomyces sp. NBC_01237]WRZ78756.1 hypothetical protein OG251_44835 [Streptomyces sp. NBC_01237]